MKNLNKASLKAALCLSFCAVFTACGSGARSFVKNAKVTTYTQNGDQWVDASVDLGTVNLLLPTLSLPLGGAGGAAGSITLSSQQGYSELKISADLNLISHIQSIDGHNLPNGNPIPIAGAANVPVVAIPVSGNVVVYVSLNPSQLMLGAAINIAEFKNLPSVNIFPSFNFGKIAGVAGIYTGSANGFAAFIDASSAIQPPATASAALARTSARPSLRFTGVMPSRRAQSNMQYALYQLGEDQRGEALNIGQ